jgi:hypothetical protein
LSTRELATTLTDWLAEDGYTVRREKEEGTEFVLIASYEPSDATKVVIRRLTNDQPPLLLSAAFRFDEAAQSRWRELSEAERDRTVLLMQIEMLRMGISYQGLGDDLAGAVIFKSFPLLVTYGSRVMSAKAFIEEVQLLRRAAGIARSYVQRSLPPRPASALPTHRAAKKPPAG